MAVILHYFNEFGGFGAIVRVAEVILITLRQKCSPDRESGFRQYMLSSASILAFSILPLYVCMFYLC